MGEGKKGEEWRVREREGERKEMGGREEGNGREGGRGRERKGEGNKCKKQGQ